MGAREAEWRQEIKEGRTHPRGQRRTYQNVRVHVPLVCLVENNDRVLAQQKVLLDLSQQNTIGHELDARVLRHTRSVIPMHRV